MAAGDSKRVVMAALLANLGIAAAKAVAAAFTGSGAMLAETIHSLADSGNQALLLLGAHRSRRPPDEKHPFGYGSERYFWAFIVAVVLFSLGSLFSLFEGVHKLLHPQVLQQPGWAYGVLLTGLVLEGISFRVAQVGVRQVRGGRRFWRYFFENKEPALPLVYLEDLGALLGLFLALLGVAASHLLSWIWADGAATLAIGLLLGAIAVVLLIRCHRLLVGESATPQDLAAVRAAAAGVDGITEVVDLKTLQIGPEYLLVCLEVRIAGENEERKVRAVERAVRSAVPSAKYVSIEPV
ncbi:MAG: cation diffusion facilitator family transporter [Planctomycetota bacterium]|jgi:cation diffusion facilitator family transporter